MQDIRHSRTDKSKARVEAIEKSTIENIEVIIKELKINQAKLKIRIYKQIASCRFSHFAKFRLKSNLNYQLNLY